MTLIDDFQNRLAVLTRKRGASHRIAPEKALTACRSLQDQLRNLKKEVLGRIYSLRVDVQEQARKPRGPKPTARELWERRDEGARELLADVKQRVTGLVDDDSPEAIEALSEINREIDARLERLTERERQLARAAGEPADLELGSRRDANPDEADDDLYAAVGAAVQKGSKHDTFCSHCGQGIEPEDRFCRRCGHNLR